MPGYRLIEQLTALIKLLVDYPQGLSMLLGSVPPPSCEDINAMLETSRPVYDPTLDPAGMPLRVDGGAPEVSEADRMIDSEERFNRIVERAGGWEHVNEVTRDRMRMYPVEWQVVKDNARWGPSRVDGVSLERLAELNGLCRDTAHRMIHDYPQRLATSVLYTPTEDNFSLSMRDPLDQTAV
jgi:hypothetical protein